MLPLDDATATRLGAWGGSIIVTVAAIWKAFRYVKRDFRTEHAEGSAETVADRTIERLSKQADRQESIIANLSARLTTLDERLTVEMEARRKAVHEALDAAQHALALQHRVDAAEERAHVAESTAEHLRTRVAALEQEVRELKLARPVAGDMP